VSKSTDPVTPTNPVAKAIWEALNDSRLATSWDTNPWDMESECLVWDRIANEAMRDHMVEIGNPMCTQMKQVKRLGLREGAKDD